MGIVFIFASFVIFTYLLLRMKRYFWPVFLGLVLKLILVSANSFFFTLPEADGDAIFYVEQANLYREIDIVGSISSVSDLAFLNGFPLMLSLFPDMIPINAFSVGLFNIFMSLISIFYFRKFLSLLIPMGDIKKWIWVVSLYPFALLYSSIPLKEPLLVAIVMYSFYAIANFIIRGSYSHIIFASLACIASSSMHTPITLLLAFLLFIPVSRIVTIRRLSLLKFFLIGLIAYTLTISLIDITPYLDYAAKVQEVAESSPSRLNYPGWLAVSDGPLLPFLIILKSIYFLFSPFIFMVSSTIHILPMMDGFFYGFLVFSSSLMIKNDITSSSEFRKEKKVIFFSIILILGYVILYSVFVSNSGLAVRHRFKFFMPMIAVFAYYRFITFRYLAWRRNRLR